MNKIVVVVLSVILAVSVVANVLLYVMYSDTERALFSERVGSHASIVQLETERNEALATVKELQDENAKLLTELSAVEAERDSLKSQTSSLITERDTALADVTVLEAEVEQLRSGKLMTNLGSSDNRDNEDQPFLHIYGVVWNVGTEAAVNWRIHVVAKQGDVVAIDGYINLNTINGYEPYQYTSFKEIDERVYYWGTALTEINVTIESP